MSDHHNELAREAADRAWSAYPPVYLPGMDLGAARALRGCRKESFIDGFIAGYTAHAQRRNEESGNG